MAFKKKIVRKTKKAYRKKATPAYSAGVKALAMVKKMQKAVEYKHTDYRFVADDVSASGFTYPLLENLPKGVNSNNRTGDKIKLARAHIWFSVGLPTGGSPGPDTRTFRVMVVRGIRENGLIPTMGTTASATRGILDDSAVSLVLARKDLDNMRDTKILLDKVYTLTPGQMTKREFRWNFKLGWTATYQEVGTAPEKTEDGGLFVLLAADYNNGDILVSMNSRITYSDD